MSDALFKRYVGMLVVVAILAQSISVLIGFGVGVGVGVGVADMNWKMLDAGLMRLVSIRGTTQY
jgi:hypothetical protein